MDSPYLEIACSKQNHLFRLRQYVSSTAPALDAFDRWLFLGQLFAWRAQRLAVSFTELDIQMLFIRVARLRK